MVRQIRPHLKGAGLVAYLRPNLSIERTFSGKPENASHLKR